MTSRARITLFLPALVLLLIVPPAASTGTIRIVLSTRVSIDTTSLHLELDIQNSGDSAAFNLAPTIEFQGATAAGPAVTVLEPSAVTTVPFAVPIAAGGNRHGRWPVVIRVGYGDEGGHRFEAIHVAVAQAGGETGPAGLRLSVPDTRIETDTTLDVDVEIDGADTAVRLTFVTPAGLTVRPRQATLPAGTSSAAVPLTLTNTSGTPSSRLPLVSIAEFDEPHGHETVVAVSFVDIGPAPPAARRQVILLLLAVFMITWIVIAAATLWRRRTRDAR